jgi:hypothetical protein
MLKMTKGMFSMNPSKSMINVTNIRYWETRRGVGYEAKTDEGSIWNDGNGGATYFDGNTPALTKKYSNLSEDELEGAIDMYEQRRGNN